MSLTETPPDTTTDPSGAVQCPDCPATFQTEIECDHHHSQAHADAPPSILDRVDPGYITQAETHD